MTTQSWIIYLTLVLVATATPGPAVLFIVTHAALHGWRKAMFAALGNIAGLFCLGVLSVVGLGAVLKTSVLLFDLVKYAGSAYLIFLGVKLILQRDVPQFEVRSGRVHAAVSPRKILFQAFGVAVSNPKAIVFLTALFPQFLVVDRPLAPQFAALIATLMTFSYAFLMTYALLAHKAKSWLSRPGRVKVFSRASGSIFIGFGLLLASSSRQ